MRINPESICVSPTTPIREVMSLFNLERRGIALAVDCKRRLLGTATDGDIRRALLKGLTLDSPIKEAMKENPIVAPNILSDSAVLKLMSVNSIRHIPIVNNVGCVVALEFLDAIADEDEVLTAVVMAGGQGQRLRPLTEKVPKPMLPVGKRPVLEILLKSLWMAGFRRILISVGYLKEAIQEHFGNGASCGLDIQYVVEKKPLGTAGALGLIPEALKPNTPFLVINGDVLTSLNFAAFRDFHMAADYELTLCCRPYEVDIPFGYPVLDGDLVTDFREKPKFNFLVNSGIYCLSPDLLCEVPPNTFLNITNLIDRLCKAKRRLGVFPLREPFHEIGRVESYRTAEAFYRENFELEKDEIMGFKQNSTDSQTLATIS